MSKTDATGCRQRCDRPVANGPGAFYNTGVVTPSETAGVHLLGTGLDALRGWFDARGLPSYRADQVLEWVYRKGATGFDQMTNLPKDLRRILADRFVLYESEVLADRAAADETRKLLLRWPDGATSECVWIPEPDRHTACISSQVGCPVRCTFCASGTGGLERQLTAGQIVEQAMRIRALVEAMQPGLRGSSGLRRGATEAGREDRRAADAPGGPSPERSEAARVGKEVPWSAAPERRSRRLTNIVLMGIGEPLANYAQVVAAVRIINARWGMNIGARKITLSTVGLPAQIRKLAEEGLQLNLAISLHASTDDLRRRLIPWAERVTIGELVEAGRYFFEKTGREVTLEYVMLAGVNMRSLDVERLARISRRMRCNVNLIPYNPVPGLGYERPDDAAIRRFLEALRGRGVNAHVRRSRGLSIDAACGQLRRARITDVRVDAASGMP